LKKNQLSDNSRTVKGMLKEGEVVITL